MRQDNIIVREKGKITGELDTRESWVYTLLDLARLKSAITTARSYNRPRRTALHEQYEAAMRDLKIRSQWARRFEKLEAEGLNLVKEGTLEVDKDKTAMIDRTWMSKFIKYAHESRLYGFTLVQLGATDSPALNEDNELTGVEVIDRKRVVPDHRVFLLKSSSNHGFRYDKPPFDAYAVPVGEPDSLGMLEFLAPYAFLKRSADLNWNKLTAVVASPQAFLELPQGLDEEERRLAEDYLRNLPDRMYGMFPEGSKLSLGNLPTGNTGDIYDKRIDALNNEIAEYILGGTMVTADGSSRSQSEVHERGLQDKSDSDVRFLQQVINDELLPRLIKLGYPLEGYTFYFDRGIELEREKLKKSIEDLPLNEQVEVLNGLNNLGGRVSARYIEDVTGLPPGTYEYPSPAGPPAPPAPEPNTAPDGDDGGEPEGDDDDEGEPADPRDGTPEPRPQPEGRNTFDIVGQLGDRIADCGCSRPDGFGITAQAPAFDEEVERVASYLRGVFEGGGSYQRQITDITAFALNEGLGKGWERGGMSFDYGTPDASRILMMESNVWRFSAAKTRDELNKLNALAKQYDKNFGDFEREAGKVVEQYNRNWLKAEYAHATNFSQAASTYLRHKERVDAGYEWWRYKTVGDSRVRPEHQRLNGVTLRHDDPLWDTIYPPNGWRCRCYVEPLLFAPEDDADGEKSRRTVQAFMDSGEFERAQKYGFDTNPINTLEVFDRSKMYLTSTRMGDLGVKANGLKAFDSIRSQYGRVSEQRQNWSKADGERWFAQKAVRDAGTSHVAHTDYRGVQLRLQEDRFRAQLSDDNAGLLLLIEQALSEPDEVYLSAQGSGATFNQYVYLKFFADQPLAVYAQLDQNGMQVLRWQLLDGERVDRTRRGILNYQINTAE